MALVDLAEFPAAAERTYLNTASVGLMPLAAERAAVAWQQDLARHGTLHFDEEAEERVFDRLRGGYARLIGAAPTDVAVASSATEMIASLAWAVAPPAGTTIVATGVGFPSTSYPWSRVARSTGARVRFVGDRGLVDQGELLEAIDASTRAVAIGLVEYSTGQRHDLEAIHARTREVGAFLMVDASQAVGGVPVDVRATPCDAMVTTSYKWLCGPFGVGLLYLAPEWQERLDPGLVGWRTNAAIYDLAADRCQMHPDARRFEFSTMAYGAALGLSAAIELLDRIGIDAISKHDLALAEELRRGLLAQGAEVISPVPLASPIVAARFAEAPAAVVRRLGRSGVVASARRDLVRFSLHLYNTRADVDRVLEAVGSNGDPGRDAERNTPGL